MSADLVDLTSRTLSLPRDIDFAEYEQAHHEAMARQFIREPEDYRDKVMDAFRCKVDAGMQTWLPALRDRLIFRPGYVTVWTGHTHHGKSRFLKQLINHGITKEGQAFLWIPPEENIPEAIKQTILVHASTSAPTQVQIDGWFSMARGQLQLFDQFGMVRKEHVLGAITYAAKELGITQVVIDNLMKVDMGNPADKFTADKEFVNELAMRGRYTGCHIHLVAHARKTDGGEEKPLGMSDIKGTGDIVNQADSVVQVFKNVRKLKEPVKRENEADTLLYVLKQRGTVSWTGRVSLGHDPQTGEFWQWRGDEIGRRDP